MIVSTRTSIQMVINTVVDLDNVCSTVNYIGIYLWKQTYFCTYIVVSLFIKPCLPLLSHTHSYFYHFYFFIMIIKLTTLSQGNLTYHSTGFSTYIMISPGREPGPGRTFAFTAQFLRRSQTQLNSQLYDQSFCNTYILISLKQKLIATAWKSGSLEVWAGAGGRGRGSATPLKTR